MSSAGDYLVMRAMRYQQAFRDCRVMLMLDSARFTDVQWAILHAIDNPGLRISSEAEAHGAWLHVLAMEEPEIAAEDLAREFEWLALKMREVNEPVARRRLLRRDEDHA